MENTTHEQKTCAVLLRQTRRMVGCAVRRRLTMTQETVELKAKKVHVVIRMKPIKFEDEYATFPSNDTILEALANCILRGEFNDKFDIVISPVEG